MQRETDIGNKFDIWVHQVPQMPKKVIRNQGTRMVDGSKERFGGLLRFLQAELSGRNYIKHIV